MSYEHAPGRRPRTGAGAGNASGASPGKRTLTDGMSRRPTGIPVVDHGAGDGSHLSDDERHRLLLSLGAVVSSAMDNFHAAIQNVRLDRHVNKPSSWGFWSEFLFYSVSGPLVAAASAGLRAVISTRDLGLDESRAAAIEANVTGTVQNVSRGVRSMLKHGGDAGGAGWDRFLKIIQGGLKEIADGLVLDAPAQLDDDGLVALVLAYRDPIAHSIAGYEDRLRAAITRFEQQKLDRVGRTPDEAPGMTSLVALTCHGHRRLAVVEDRAAHVAQDGSMIEAPTPASRTLLSLVDDDLAEVVAAQPGGVAEVIDVTAGHPFVVPVDDHLTAHVAVELDRWRARATARPNPQVEPIDPNEQAEDVGRAVVDAVDPDWRWLS